MEAGRLIKLFVAEWSRNLVVSIFVIILSRFKRISGLAGIDELFHRVLQNDVQRQNSTFALLT